MIFCHSASCSRNAAASSEDELFRDMKEIGVMEQLEPGGTKIAVIVGATSKWQADGANTTLMFGHNVPDADMPYELRWGIGGALALKFAAEGYLVALTTRRRENATSLAEAIAGRGGRSVIVELDLSSRDSIA